ncbi:hypothetical protein TNCV_287511 [Trichonephila clavipes]|nr:hypothetical protein TNCV_287511 [Trichonephila clavipes]
MKSKSKGISVSERKIIEQMSKDGKSRRDTDRFVGREFSSIQWVIENFKSTGVYTSKPRTGRPSKLTIREQRRFVNTIHLTSNKNMLNSVLKDELEKISSEETTRLVNSMPK